MQEVSQEWLYNQQELLTEPAKIKIEYTSTDDDIMALSEQLGDVNWHDPTQISGNNGQFSEPYPTYTINFSKPIEKSIILSIQFCKNGQGSAIEGVSIEEYATEFDLLIYNNSELLESKKVYNNNLNKSLIIEATNYNKIEIVFKYWNRSSIDFEFDDHYAWIDNVYVDTIKTLTNDDITSLDASQTIDLNSFSLSKSELVFSLDNSDGRYNPDNPVGMLKYLNKKKMLSVYFGYEFLDENDEKYIEWIDGGKYYITEWDIPQNGITATFTARDAISFMDVSYTSSLTPGIIGGGYKEVEYIYGNNSYIDTSYVPPFDNDSEIELDFSLQNTNSQTLIGCSAGTQSIVVDVNNGNLRITYLGTTKTVCSVQANKRYTLLASISAKKDYPNVNYMSCGVYDAINSAEIGYKFIGYGEVTGQIPDLPLYLCAKNNNGTAQNFSNAKIEKFVVTSYADSFYLNAIPCYNIVTSDIGLFATSNSTFYIGNGFSKGADLVNPITLYDVALSAFYQSDMPSGFSNTNIFEQYLSEELKKYPVTVPNDFNHTCAEVVQLCANAAKCVWYFDRKGLSHIEPMELFSNTLPEEYQEVEYIETTGTQYIDTEVIPNITTKILTEITISDASYNMPVFGTNAGSWFCHICPYQNKWYYGSNNVEKNAGSISLQIGDKYVCYYGNKLEINNEIVATDIDPSSNSSICIARRNTYYSKYRYKNFIILDNNKYIRYMIPCYRKSDEVIGMYDLINGVFYTNDGTGVFLKGNDIERPLPDYSDYVIDRELNAYQNGEYSITPELKEVNINKDQAIVNIANSGETQTVENELIQSETQALTVAKWIADTLKHRRTVSGEYRADPRADILDCATVKNKYSLLNVILNEVNYSFNGAFKGNYSGKVINSFSYDE